jgi:HAD superfamily hydrolase (TIGR01509 family)
MIEAVIFDMDGVLIDARDWHFEALNRALHLFGYEIDRAEHLTTFDGLPTRRKLEILTATRGFPRGLHEFVNTLKQAYTMELVHTRCRPIFQHRYLLSRLRQAGVKMAVASNSVRASVDAMIGKADLAEYMDLLLSNEDVAKPKPDPEIYQMAIARLGVTPSATLIVEDNDHGIKAARAAGARVMVVSHPGDLTYERFLRYLQPATDTGA